MTITPSALLFFGLVGLAIAFSLSCFGLGFWAGKRTGRPQRLPRREVKERLARMVKRKKPPEPYDDPWHKGQQEPQGSRIPTMEV